MTSGFLPFWEWLLILSAIIVVSSLEYAHRQTKAAKAENTKGAIIQITKIGGTFVAQSNNDPALFWEWDKLFMIDKTAKTLKLRFLPDTDTKNRRNDACLLVLLGYKVIFDIYVRSSKLNEEIKRAYRECQNRPNAALSVLMGLATVFDDTDYGRALTESGEAERNRLSDGGFLELTMDGDRRARALAWEAIRRA